MDQIDRLRDYLPTLTTNIAERVGEASTKYVELAADVALKTAQTATHIAPHIMHHLSAVQSLGTTKRKTREEAERMMSKYPDRIPVLVTPNKRSSTTPPIDKQKFLVPSDLTVGQLLFVIRKRLHMSPERALFLFVDQSVVSNSELVSLIYNDSHDREDGFLHVVYSCESVFG